MSDAITNAAKALVHAPNSATITLPEFVALRAAVLAEETPILPPQPLQKVIRFRFMQAKYHSPRGGAAIQGILLHASEGHAAGDIPTLLTGDGRSVSAHWYIQRDGSIIHMVQDTEVANHAGAVGDDRFSNHHSIGIEMERKSPQDYPQIQTCASLCAFLCQKHGDLVIGYHKDVAIPKGRKSDPENFPRSLFDTLLVEAKKIRWTAVQV